ncbi:MULTISPECIES: hypothetical protein [unclassified Oceanobacillus]|uniref:hypothetical protein n=1 Tax=Oceanobacillus TaxID=182709 RepID=UPI001BE79866|nr:MULTISPECIES: hypothetical protein [unclassified Oceanobacillus]MBT2601412.1 hypothetical protein [Oceanobacillus sp. ISL-74]MBT2653311.1 hypothetical protein [Oceanobacillus sp. ISL-73]
MEDGTHVELELTGARMFEQGVIALGRVYNHPKTHEHVRHFIIFELQKIFGKDYDIMQFFKEPICQVDAESLK